MDDDTIDGIFDGFDGRKTFCVYHPNYGRGLTIKAPNEDAAMVKAAEIWGVRWQSYEYYPYVTVMRIR